MFANIWLNGDEPTRVRSFRKEDCRRLQVIQNRVLRLKTGLLQDTPVSQLIEQSQDLSIHQASAYHSLVLVHKITKSGTPDYLATKLALKRPPVNGIFPIRQAFTIPLTANLATSRSGFCHRAARVFNQLPVDLRSCESTNRFKKETKTWVKRNIAIKPPWIYSLVNYAVVRGLALCISVYVWCVEPVSLDVCCFVRKALA